MQTFNGVRTAPVFRRVHRSSASARTLKIPKHWQTLAAIPLFEHKKMLYTLTGMGSTAVALNQVMPPTFPARQFFLLFFFFSFFLSFSFLFFFNLAMRAQEPCEGRGGRLGLPVPNSP